jgi:DNA-binding SARP family transcriptional activator
VVSRLCGAISVEHGAGDVGQAFEARRGRTSTADWRRGDVERARTLAERALLADPRCEDGHQLLIAVHLDAGDLGSAQRCLRRCYEMLADLGLPAGQRTAALARQVQGRR